MDSEDQARRLAFQRRLAEAVFDKLGSCTFPFYALENENYELYGSGVLLSIGQKHFGITAAHVLDEIGRCFEQGFSVLVPPGKYGEKLLRLGKFGTYRTPVPKEGGRRNDYFDIGIIDFPPETADTLSKTRRFLTITDLDPWETLRPTSGYLVFGYPTEGSKPDHDTKSMIYEPMPYLTRLYDGDYGKLTGFQNDVEIVVKFDPERSSDQDGTPSGRLQPPGVSGGGLWRVVEDVAESDQWEPQMVKLVGIGHTWSESVGVIRGTHIRVVTDAIFHHFPELRPAMKLVYPK